MIGASGARSERSERRREGCVGAVRAADRSEAEPGAARPRRGAPGGFPEAPGGSGGPCNTATLSHGCDSRC